MRLEEFLKLAAPSFSLDWSYEPHCVALATTMYEHAGTDLEPRVNRGEPQAYVELLGKVVRKVRDAAVLRRAFSLEAEPKA